MPYIASGGFGDGRGLAAALALGACVRRASSPFSFRHKSLTMGGAIHRA